LANQKVSELGKTDKENPLEEKLRRFTVKILCLDNCGERALGILREVAEVKKERWAGDKYDGLIVGLNTEARSQHLSFMFPNLKFIASCTTGLDHIGVDYCKEKGIKIISLQGERDFLQDVYATAEHTWALILSLIRKVPFAFDDVKQGNWNREAWQGTELHGKTLGIVGYGRVGQQVAKIAEAFGMNIIRYDKQKPGYNFYSINTVLQNSDIITVHVPLNEETQHMFGRHEFEMMKPTAYFINTSRGMVVDTKALVDALRLREIAGAAIDVVEGEPQIPKSIDSYRDDNFIITPHIAGNTAESREKTQVFIANKIKEFINGIR